MSFAEELLWNLVAWLVLSVGLVPAVLLVLIYVSARLARRRGP